MTNNSRGSTSFEALTTATVLVIFVGGILLAAYLTFARAWLQYQSEQALYCLSEGQIEISCRRQLQMKITQVLPWGRIAQMQLRSSREHFASREKWEVEIEWRIQNFSLQIRRELNARLLIKSKALLW